VNRNDHVGHDDDSDGYSQSLTTLHTADPIGNKMSTGDPPSQSMYVQDATKNIYIYMHIWIQMITP
jgi:hypothetical protein